MRKTVNLLGKFMDVLPSLLYLRQDGKPISNPCRGGAGFSRLPPGNGGHADSSVGECAPHFLFVPEKKTGRARSKRKEAVLKHSFSTTGYDLLGLIQLRRTFGASRTLAPQL